MLGGPNACLYSETRYNASALRCWWSTFVHSSPAFLQAGLIHVTDFCEACRMALSFADELSTGPGSRRRRNGRPSHVYQKFWFCFHWDISALLPLFFYRGGAKEPHLASIFNLFDNVAGYLKSKTKLLSVNDCLMTSLNMVRDWPEHHWHPSRTRRNLKIGPKKSLNNQ